MENTNYTVRKTICFEDFISRKEGIFPYCEKDSDFNGIKYPKQQSYISNYASFPCDIVTINFSEIYNNLGLNYRDIKEISRLKYMDIISWYNKSIEIVNKGILLKRYEYKIEKESVIICEEAVSNTSINEQQGSQQSEYNNKSTESNRCYSVNGTENETMYFYEYTMADAGLFKIVDGKYVYDKEYTNIRDNIKQKYGTGDQWVTAATEEEKFFIRKINHHICGENDNCNNDYHGGIIFDDNSKYDYLYFVDDYDTIIKYDNYWQKWWDDNWKNCVFNEKPTVQWELYYFGPNYHLSSLIGKNFKDFKFIYDFEKYFLGKQEVLKSIKGEKVPNIVYYLNTIDYLQWFIANEENKENDEDLMKEWNNRGGDYFYNFLSSVISKTYFIDWKSYENIPNLPENTGETTVILCRPQNIEFDIQLEGEISDEKLLTPYEYSVNEDGIVYDATIMYESGGPNQIESALTPVFKEFDDGEITVESQLRKLYCDDVYYVNEDCYGIFDVFSEENGLFECVFHTGESSGNIYYLLSGMVETFRNNIHYSYTRIPEQPRNNMSPDIVPTTRENAYMVLISTITKKHSPTITATTVQQPVSSATWYDSNNNEYYSVSSVTWYDKRGYNDWKWCECVPFYELGIPLSAFTCGDGENINFNYKNVNDTGEYKYRNILLLDCAMSLSEETSDGSKYYYMAKYDNGYTDIGQSQPITSIGQSQKFLKIPFIKGKKMNIESYLGEYSGVVKYDMVKSSGITDDTFTIEYVIGAESGDTGDKINTTGIHYKDEYFYSSSVTETIVDGYYKSHVLYENIRPKKVQEVYSEDLNAKRTAVLSDITKMEIGTQWTSGSSIKTYLFNEEDSDFMMEYPLINADINFNRGNASAFEKHFKLAECNTMEDLESYGNGYFLK